MASEVFFQMHCQGGDVTVSSSWAQGNVRAKESSIKGEGFVTFTESENILKYTAGTFAVVLVCFR